MLIFKNPLTKHFGAAALATLVSAFSFANDAEAWRGGGNGYGRGGYGGNYGGMSRSFNNHGGYGEPRGGAYAPRFDRGFSGGRSYAPRMERGFSGGDFRRYERPFRNRDNFRAEKRRYNMDRFGGSPRERFAPPERFERRYAPPRYTQPMEGNSSRPRRDFTLPKPGYDRPPYNARNNQGNGVTILPNQPNNAANVWVVDKNGFLYTYSKKEVGQRSQDFNNNITNKGNTGGTSTTCWNAYANPSVGPCNGGASGASVPLTARRPAYLP
jgi:hypothetical protein